MTLRLQLGNHFAQALRVRHRAAHGDHHDHANVRCLRRLQHVLLRRLMQQVVAGHHGVEVPVARHALKHVVAHVGVPLFRDAQKADLAGPLSL